MTFNIALNKIDEKNKLMNLIGTFIKPFNLSTAPLFRLKLIELSEKKYFVFYDIHHIISDGVSMEILENEFVKLYAGKKLAPINIHYKDYAVWHNKMIKKNGLKDDKLYWLKQLHGFIF